MDRPTRSMIEVTHDPYNAETPLSALLEPATPSDLVYVRNHFDIPHVSAVDWALKVTGEVQRPLSMSLPEIQAHDVRTLTLVLECAGNGRTRMRPTPRGTPWGYGAVSVVRATGTPLLTLLGKAGINPNAAEVLFLGLDRGEVEPGRAEQYGRSLPMSVAMHPDTLLVWALNNEPLSPEHGRPLRVVVPGWYGMASVKWLAEVKVLRDPFQGFFQSEHYVYMDEAGTPQGEPTRRIRVRSLITQPAEGAKLRDHPIEILGVAWSGDGPVTRVELSTDGGNKWTPTVLASPNTPYGIQPWRYIWRPEAKGKYSVMCRATDASDNTQPSAQRWNRLGYGNNGPHTIDLEIL